jgi:hypothetical protein
MKKAILMETLEIYIYYLEGVANRYGFESRNRRFTERGEIDTI